jgi:hypothetical protein
LSPVSVKTGGTDGTGGTALIRKGFFCAAMRFSGGTRRHKTQGPPPAHGQPQSVTRRSGAFFMGRLILQIEQVFITFLSVNTSFYAYFGQALKQNKRCIKAS